MAKMIFQLLAEQDFERKTNMEHSTEFSHVFLFHILPFILICAGFYGFFKLLVFFHRRKMRAGKGGKNKQPRVQFEGVWQTKFNRRKRRK